ncbi:MAG: amidohydrolase [Dehalococcoidia bacterium]|nr:MAG: amidohydrolase [Dehalococcoidia bacterium]
MARTITIATSQYPVTYDVTENLHAILSRIAEAADHGADLVMFPEFSNHAALYRDQEHCWEVAVDPAGDWVGAIREAARRHKIWVVFNATTRGEKPAVYLQNYLIDRHGEVVGTARKQVLIYLENDFIQPSDAEATVFDTELGRIGLYSCMDGIVPETARNLALRGAQLLLNTLSSNARDEGALHIPVRAAENHVWVASSCKSGPLAPHTEVVDIILEQTGMKRHLWNAPGESQIVDPSGTPVAKGGYDTTELVYATIQPDLADEKRIPGVGDLFADRRPDVYQLLIEPNDRLPIVTNPSRRPVAPLRAAAIQVGLGKSVEATVLRATDLAHEAADNGATLVVFPELFPFAPGAPGADPARAAAESEAVRLYLERFSVERGAIVVASLVEREGDHFYHTAFLWENGALVGTYRQVHLREPDRAWATAGDDVRAFDTAAGRIGLMVGYDGLFPEMPRMLALLGSDLVLYPTTWFVDWEPDLAVPERAAENHLSIVAAVRPDSPIARGSIVATVPRFPQPFRGKLNPSYLTLAPAGCEAILFQTVDPEASRNKVMLPQTDAVLNRRPHLYRPLVEPAVGIAR